MENTEKEKDSFITTELKKFDIADAVISQMRTDYMALTITGLEDKEGYKAVKDAKSTVTGVCIGVEEKRKELKADSLQFGRAIDAEAKRITALLEPIKTYLTTQKDIIDNEKLRIKQETERVAQERLQERINVLTGYNQGFDVARLGVMSDVEFTEMAERSRVQHETNQKELQEAERLRLIEAARLMHVAAEQESERNRLAELDRIQKAEANRIESERQIVERENERIQQEKLNMEHERLHRIEVEQAQKVAADNARIDLERRLKHEAEQKIEAERLSALEAERQLALLPEREKLKNYAEKIRSLIEEMPDIEFVPFSHIRDVVLEDLIHAVNRIMGSINVVGNKVVNDDDWR